MVKHICVGFNFVFSIQQHSNYLSGFVEECVCVLIPEIIIIFLLS